MVKQIFFAILIILSIKLTAQDKVYYVNSGELIKEGAELHDNGKYKEAILKYKEVPENDTNFVLAQYEISLSARIDSQYEVSRAACRKALEFVPTEYEHDLLLNIGNAYDDEKKYDSAGYAFDKLIARFPNSFLAYHAKGINFYLRKQYDSAFATFKKVLIMNPYAFNTHYYMGQLANELGYPIQAMMSYAANLAISPSNARWNLTIGHLDAISNWADSISSKYNNRKPQPFFNEDYTELETLFKSKIAFEKAYDVNATYSKEAFIRQLHLIIEKLPETYNHEKEFWNAFYGVAYREVFAKKLFDAFTLRMISNVNNKEIQASIKKESSSIAKMNEVVDNHIAKIGYYKTLDTKEFVKDQPGMIYEDNKPIAFGKLVNNDRKKLEGSWIFYNVLGEKRSEATFIKNKLEGVYKSYYYTGTPKEIYNYSNEKLHGEQQEFYNNGVKKSISNFSNGKLNGNFKQYYKNGSLASDENYVEGDKIGAIISCYESGAKHYEYATTKNGVEGVVNEYYVNGKILSTSNYAKGKANGDYVAYHSNGKVSEKGKMEEGLKEGEYLQYDEDGNLVGKFLYKKGKLNGEQISYHANGKIEQKGIYSNGDKDGEIIDYNEDGIEWCKTMYKNGRIKSISYHNVLNNQLVSETAITEKDKNSIKLYNEIGCMTKDVVADRDAYFNGDMTEYYVGNIKRSSSNWKKGKRTGKDITYYQNGQILSEYNYEDDELHGVFKTYYRNGKLKEEGEYVHGVIQGATYSYNEFGHLSEKDFFVDGEFHGPQYYYYASGKLNKIISYRFGEETKIEQYDTIGNKIKTINIKAGEPNAITEVNPLGKPERTYTFTNNHLQGKDEGFYANGKTKYTTNYSSGKTDGTYTNYNSFGGKAQEGTYDLGNQIGTWYRYYKNGKKERITSYKSGDVFGNDSLLNDDGTVDLVIPQKNDNRHGWMSKYAPSGELMYKYHYINGFIVGYTYEKPDGTLMPEIPVENSDKLVNIITYYKNGKVACECEYQYGEYHGKRKIFFPDGKTYIDAVYEYGDHRSQAKEFYTNGNVKEILNYDNNGEQHGVQKYFNSQNILTREENYINGYLHGPYKIFDDNGQLLKTITYYWGHEMTNE